jgi:hypothetical protein
MPSVELKAVGPHDSLPRMHASPVVTALGALAMIGCATSPAHPAAAPVPGASRPAAAVVATGNTEAGAAPASGGSDARGESDDHRVARQTHRALGWVFLSVGAEAAVVATITSFIMLHQNSVRSDHCVDKVCSSGGLAANETLHNLAWWNAGAWAVAGVGGSVGALVLWTNPSDAALHAEVGIGPAGSGSALLFRGAF